jgi:hypothetical protein
LNTESQDFSGDELARLYRERLSLDERHLWEGPL